MIKFLASLLCRLANGHSAPVCNFLASVPCPKLLEVFIVDSDSDMSDSVSNMFQFLVVVAERPVLVTELKEALVENTDREEKLARSEQNTAVGREDMLYVQRTEKLGNGSEKLVASRKSY